MGEPSPEGLPLLLPLLFRDFSALSSTIVRCSILAQKGVLRVYMRILPMLCGLFWFIMEVTIDWTRIYFI